MDPITTVPEYTCKVTISTMQSYPIELSGHGGNRIHASALYLRAVSRLAVQSPGGGATALRLSGS